MHRVLFVTDMFVTGGVERVLLDSFRGLDQSGFELTLLLPAPGGDLESEIPEHVRVRYVHQRDPRSTRRGSAAFYVRQFAGIGALNRRAVRGDAFDVVVAHKASSVGRIVGIPGRRICFVHNTMDDVRAGPFSRLTRHHLRSMDTVACVSEGVRREVEDFIGPGHHVVVLRNPLDDERIRALSAMTAPDLSPAQHFRIVSVGRLDKVKRFDRLIDAASQLRDEGLQFEVLIIGDGPERPTLQRRIERECLEGVVQLLGRRGNPYPYMRSADLFVLPTSSEGFATVLTEAVILRTPVVATDVVGTDEPLGYGKYGRLVVEGSEGIAEAVRECMRRPDVLRELQERSDRGAEDLTFASSLQLLAELLRRS